MKSSESKLFLNAIGKVVNKKDDILSQDPDQAFTQQPSLVEDDVAILELCKQTSSEMNPVEISPQSFQQTEAINDSKSKGKKQPSN